MTTVQPLAVEVPAEVPAAADVAVALESLSLLQAVKETAAVNAASTPTEEIRRDTLDNRGRRLLLDS